MSGEQADAVFAALADPTRRRLLLQLAGEGPLSATQLAAAYSVSRQAIVKHLAALSDAGVVHAERRGREVQYEIQHCSLDEAANWLTAIGLQWDQRLDKLRRHFDERPPK